MIKITVIISLVLLLTGWTSNFDRNAGKLIPSTNVYEVDGKSSRPDIIEFVPKGDKSKLCLIVLGVNSKPVGITCFDKKEENQ